MFVIPYWLNFWEDSLMATDKEHGKPLFQPKPIGKEPPKPPPEPKQVGTHKEVRQFGTNKEAGGK